MGGTKGKEQNSLFPPPKHVGFYLYPLFSYCFPLPSALWDCEGLMFLCEAPKAKKESCEWNFSDKNAGWRSIKMSD